MSKLTRKRQSRKPHADFPLTKHPRGYWCKKVKGKLRYFGKIESDPEGQDDQADDGHRDGDGPKLRVVG